MGRTATARLILPFLAAAGLAGPAAAQEGITLNELREQLAKHPFFGRLKYGLGDASGPFVVFLQHTDDAPPELLPRISGLFGPWLAELWTILERDYLWPTGLPRNRKAGPYAVFIAGNDAVYKNIQRYCRKVGTHDDAAMFYPELDMIVTRYDARSDRPPTVEDRFALLSEVVHEVLRSYYQGEGDRAPEAWYVEGLATYRASHTGDDPSILAEPPPPADALAVLGPLAADDERWRAAVLPLAELTKIEDGRQRLAIFRTHAMEVGASMPGTDEVESAFQAQAAMWMHFLDRGEGGRYRSGVRRYLERVLTHTGGPDALGESLGLDDLGVLDEPFRAWVRLLAGGGEVPPLSPDAVAVTTPALLVEPEAARTYLALALQRARAGRLADAIARIEAGLAANGDDPLAARMQRELERVRTLQATRDSFLASLVGSKTRLRADLPQGKLSATVDGLEDGVLQLGRNKLDLETLSVEAIPAVDLADTMDFRVAEHGPAWVGPYGQLLGGESRWDRDLEESDAATALRTDAEDYEELLHAGLAGAALEQLASTPLPETVADARAINGAVADLLERYGDVSFVREKHDPLRGLARRAWSEIYDVEGLAELLQADVELGESGYPKIVYEFDDGSQAEDFEPVENYLEARRAELPVLGKEAANPSLVVRNGALEGIGALCYRHKLTFETPMTVRWSVKYGSGKDKTANFWIGVCDDRQENYVAARDIFDLQAVDLPSRLTELVLAEGTRTLTSAKPYKVELRHDGAVAHLVVDGKPRGEIRCGSRRSGGFFLWLHSDVKIELQRLEIEARVSPSFLEVGRVEWVEERLEEMGL